jgi:hypothetical protein
MSDGTKGCEERGTLTHGMSLKSSFRTRALSYALGQLMCLLSMMGTQGYYYSQSFLIAKSSIRIIVASIDGLKLGDPDLFFHG